MDTTSLAVVNNLVTKNNTTFIFSACISSAFGGRGAGEIIRRFAGTRVTIPSSGNKRLIYRILDYGCHCGTGSSSDLCYTRIQLRKVSSGNSIVATTGDAIGGRGGAAVNNNTQLSIIAEAGHTYELWLRILPDTDDHWVAFSNGGFMYVLDPSLTTIPEGNMINPY